MERLSESDLKMKPSEVFDVSIRLGKGSYGVVYMAKHRECGETIAVKKVPVDSDLSDIVKEISIMQQCNSPFIVKYYGSYFDDYDLWICMEYCGAGSVSDIMRLRCFTMQESEMATILQQCLLGLHYLHNLKKIHRDIKAGNILLNMEGQAKLADFGVAGQLSDTLAKRNTVIGTPYWMAPEVIQEIGYNFSADIWSLGITAIEMADGKPPYVDVHPMRALFMIPYSNPPTVSCPDNYSSEFNQFLAECLVKDPNKRSTSLQLLKHSFIVNAKSSAHLKPMIKEAVECRSKKTINDTLSTIDSNNGPTGVSDVVDDDGGTMIHKNITLNEDEDAATMISMLTSTSESSAKSFIRHPSSHFASASSDSSFADTMVINAVEDEEENDGTLTTSRYKPSFLKGIDKNENSSVNNQKILSPNLNGDGIININSKNNNDSNINNASNGNAKSKQNNNNNDNNNNNSSNKNNIENIYLPFPRKFQDGQFEDLGKMNANQLRKHLESLDTDLKRELDSLALRYQHKRQPILDAINDKKQAKHAVL